jgi:hypothetical protein
VELQAEGHRPLPTGTTLFRFNGVPIVAQPAFWPIPVLVTAGLAWLAGWRKPQRTGRQRLAVALAALPVALLAEIGHAMAHTVSARLAGAPMDEILLSSGMPRTLYLNNAVSPRAHIWRALGGPAFNALGATLSLVWRDLSPRGSLSRDLADLSLASHGFLLLASLTPLPVIDGGVILKWKLVEAGHAPAQADQMVRQASLRLGGALLGLGGLLGLSRKSRLVGGALAAGGAAIAASLNWLK